MPKLNNKSRKRLLEGSKLSLKKARAPVVKHPVDQVPRPKEELQDNAPTNSTSVPTRSITRLRAWLNASSRVTLKAIASSETKTCERVHLI